jgi:hypothetical protein
MLLMEPSFNSLPIQALQVIITLEETCLLLQQESLSQIRLR